MTLLNLLINKSSFKVFAACGSDERHWEILQKAREDLNLTEPNLTSPHLTLPRLT